MPVLPFGAGPASRPERSLHQSVMRVVNIKPRPGARFLIGLVPIVVILIVYAVLAAARLEANPNDRVLPTFTAMGQAAPMGRVGQPAEFGDRRQPLRQRLRL